MQHSACQAVGECKLPECAVLPKKQYQEVSNIHSGEILNRLTSDVDIVVGGVVSLIPQAISMLTKIAAGLFVLFSLDARERFSFVNPRIETFLGYPVSDVLETSLRDYVAPEDRHRLDTLESLEPETIWDEEVAVLDHDGARKIARTTDRSFFP